ncbi:MAG: archease [Candidatus ainarchaeum sp.]|nr:archease [Candidatus ainarchaeum sp.]
MPYKFLEGLTMADVAFEATGKTLEGMFASAADAMMSTQVKDLKKVEPKVETDFCINAADEERLLHDFLQELIFFKDAERLLFSSYELKITKAGGGFTLKAKARGEPLDMRKHELLIDVKAVTWNKFKVEKTARGWKAVVIIDV